jgi:ribosome recycling factor
MDDLKRGEKEHKISEDEHRDFSRQVQIMTDGYIRKIDDLLAHKEKDIMQV